MSNKVSHLANGLARAKQIANATGADDSLRRKVALNTLREMEQAGYHEYYKAKYNEAIDKTIDKAKKGDIDSILQLIEWDKFFFGEYYVIAMIKKAEFDLAYFIGDNPHADFKSIRSKARRFLDRVSKSAKKVSQLPKVKKYWNLLSFLRNHSHEHTIASLTDFARKNKNEFPANSPEENLLTDKRALLVRFIGTHKEFIGVKK